MAFGNPNISTNPIYDEYLSSQADIYGNSFSNPMNPANMNSGWGIDPSLLTPSYTAPFRPQYSGPNPGTHFGRPGFFHSLSRLNPMSPDIMWGNPYMHQQQYADAIGTRPADAMMWGAQRIAMPVAGMWAAGKMMGGFNSFGAAKGAFSAGKAFGGGLGSGLAKSIGLGRFAGGFSSTLGFAGGAIAGYALPIAAMQAMAWGGEKAIFNPYINNRRTGEDLRNNFSGITFADSIGHSVTGGGLGGRESATMASQITSQGINDMSFSTGQYGAGASMVMRSGMLDNASAGQLTKRIKESMDQVKLIMSIASMPEMKDAVEQLAKFQQMGASTIGGQFSTAGTSIRQIGALARVAGTSVQHMMNTVGAQGQYLYQANGMTPYLGQIAAANSYSAFSAANRMGLISSAQLSRLGGLDGATQASLTGQINVAQTLYNKIGNYNQYLGDGRSNSMIGNLNRFGQSMVNDPMGVYGSMLIHGRQMAGRQIEERGSLAVEDQLMQIAQNLPGLLGKDGRITLERAVPLLMQMGMSEDQIHAFATQRISEQDQGAYRLSMKAMDRNLVEQQRQYISQNGIYGGVIGAPVYEARKFGRRVTKGISSTVVNPITETIGGISDAVSRATDWAWYGGTTTDAGLSVEDVLGGKVDRTPLKYLDDHKSLISGANSNHTEVAAKINSLAKSGNADAIRYLRASGSGDRKKALDAVLKSGALGDELTSTYLKSGSQYNELNGFLDKRNREESTLEKVGGYLGDLFGKTDNVKDFNSKLAEASGLKGADRFDSAQAIGMSFDVAARIQGGSLTSLNIDKELSNDETLKKLSKLTGITDGSKLMDFATSHAGTAVKHGLVGFGTASLKVDRNKYKTSDEALKAAAAKNGDRIYEGTLDNADRLTDQEKIGYGMAAQQDAKMRAGMEEKLRSGRIDFSGYQSTINTLDQKKIVDKFDKAVDKFAKIMDSKDKPGSVLANVTSVFRSDAQQRLLDKAAGNK